METIRTTWFKKGNPRMLEVDCDENCLWFSLDYKSVPKIIIYPGAFTECENADKKCISSYLKFE